MLMTIGVFQIDLSIQKHGEIMLNFYTHDVS